MKTQRKQANSTTPVQPASGEINVETTPLPLGGALGRLAVAEWRGPHEGVLALSPRKWRLGFGAALVGVSILAAMSAWRCAHGACAESDLGLIGFGVFFGVGFLLLLAGLKSYTFDRNRAMYTLGTLIGRFHRPLTDIRGVQVITGGIESNRDSESRGTPYQTYQLNLVLHGVTPRQNISVNGDLAGTRIRGRALAEFLGVPFLDQIDATRNNR